MTKHPVDPRRHRIERIVAAVVVLLAAAGAAGVLWWSTAQKKALESDQRYIPRAVEMTPEIQLLQDFVRIDTSTPAGAAAGARWLADQLRKGGVQPELIASTPDRLNVYARIRGRKRGEGLMLFNHIDVVPPGERWSHPPFEGVITLNMMYGRGTVDMKAMTICQLLAFLEVARGKAPEHDLVFLATADEETGSEFGMRWLIANRPDVLADVKYGITEGGITEIMGERMTYFGIETGGKQFVEHTLEADSAEALSRARIALEPYIFSREPQRVLPAVRHYFRQIAPTRMSFKPYLADIDRTIREGEFWRLPPTYRDLTQNSLWASAPQKDGDRWTMLVRHANLPDENPDARLAWLAGLVEPYGVRMGEVRQKQGPVPVSPHETRLFSILAAQAERRYGVPAGTVILFRSATDSRFLRPLGIICYGLSPYPVDFYQSSAVHGRDERIRLDAFLAGVGYLRRSVAEWAAAST